MALGCMLFCTNSDASKNRLVDPKTPAGGVPVGYKLVFSDEFNGHEIDRTKWNIGINKQNIQNNGVQCVYTWKNVLLREGQLVFVQQREDSPVSGKVYGPEKNAEFNYTSGGMNTGGKFELTNNMYVELRVKLPSNSGGYAAFWGMAGKKGAPPEDRMELDWFEYIADQKKARFWSGLWFSKYAG